MKSLGAFYQSDLLPDLEKLEAQRLIVKKKFMQAIFIVAGLNLVFLFVAGKFGINILFLFMFLVLSAIFTFFPWHIKYYRGYHAGFKGTIIPRIVAYVDQRLQYDQAGMVSREDFAASRLFNDRVSEYHGDDLVSGTLGETAIRFSEIHAKRVDIVRSNSSSSTNKTKKSYTPIFNGLFFVADFNKSFKGTTIVLPDTAQKLFGDLGQALQSLNVQNGQLIKLEDPEFEKMFVVYGQDQVEARYILSTSLMRRIIAFQQRARQNMRLSFSASKLYVAIPFEKALFEPKIMESLLNPALVQEYYEDLKLVVDIVEELNLNTRIWTSKRETPAAAASAVAAASATGSPGIEATPPPPPGLGKRQRYSEAETQAMFKDFVNKADSSVRPKIKTAKRWLKRIGAVFFLLLCLPFLFTGSYMPGLILLGIGLFLFAGGFLGAGIEKIAFSVLFTGLGIGMVLLAYTSYKTAVGSKTWPTVDGVVTLSEIERQTSTSGDGADKKTTVQYSPKIVYRYQIDGQNYEGTRISFASESGNAQQIVSNYPKGKSVRVYYNPGKHKQAVLVPGSGSVEKHFVPLIFAAVFFMVGLGSAAKLRKQTAALGNHV
jgi:energy-coupling factor transporter transmembrane protein EcfT